MLIDVATCTCCAACAHEEVLPGQFAPCTPCGLPVTSSALVRGVQQKTVIPRARRSNKKTRG